VLFVGNQLQRVVAVLGSIRAAPANGKHIGAFDFVTSLVAQPESDSVLSGECGPHRLGAIALLVGLGWEAGDDLLQRLQVIIVGDPQQINGTFRAADRCAIQHLSLEVDVDAIAGLIVPALRPGVDFERLLGSDD
jgi:hypothetical protein